MHVPSGQQPVFCIRPNDSEIITPSPPIHIFLLKEITDGNTPTFYKYIAGDRYYYQHGCLWMKSLQETDNGNYIMQIKTCFPNVNFTFPMTVIIKSTSEFYVTLQICISIYKCAFSILICVDLSDYTPISVPSSSTSKQPIVTLYYYCDCKYCNCNFMYTCRQSYNCGPINIES